ncbi:MAG: isoprenylcysteine carboxylmethyltransferase family protein [Actinobacteria bacterium]|nr:isoprenylcysteine carboxylmethyltransferase family protein [Actinomycetota bacterium]
MGRVEDSNAPSRWPSRIFVLIQGIILFLLIFTHFKVGLQVRQFMWVGSPFEWLGIIGILVSARSLGSALTAMPLPKKGGKMTSRGLYRYVRHPMYSSVLLFTLGVAINYGDLYKYILVGSLYLLFYFKSSYEERLLVSTYPDYESYAKNTPRFIPTFNRKKYL